MTAATVDRDPASEPTARRRFTLDLRDPATVIPKGRHRVGAIVIGLIVSAIYLSRQPGVGGTLGQTAWNSTFGNELGFSQVLEITMPLLVAGCAAALAQGVGMWNLGIQGQLIFGAWVTTLVAYTVPNLPGEVLIPILLLAGCLGGAVWMLVPAFARAFLKVDEIITTLMLNFVAALWLAYWATGPWAQTNLSSGAATGALFSRELTSNAFLPQFEISGVTFGLALPIALALAVCLWAAMRWSHFGLNAQLTGSGDELGRYAGVRTRTTRFSILLLSGAVAGLCGALVELDKVHSFSTPITANDPGYIGVVVALLAGNYLLAAIPSAVLIAVIVVVGTALQLSGIDPSVIYLMTGLLLLFAACSNLVGRIDIHRRGAETKPVEEGS
ncbi:MAG: ABC transporter permease [Actinobacteria bacterium]|nr:ABC transporter permease [Actinomycetota bacterium]